MRLATSKKIHPSYLQQTFRLPIILWKVRLKGAGFPHIYCLWIPGGTSVLTAYSGDKLNDKVVAKAMADAQVEMKVKHRKLIIPGLVAVMSGKLQETLGWEILVGPREASGLPSYLKTVWRA